MPVNRDLYEEVVARINRKYEGDLKQGDEYDEVSSIPTDSPELNIAMGGGVPMGRWTRFYGPYHSGKTLNALCVMRNAMDMGMYAAYYNVEKQWDKVHAENLGLRTNEISLVEGTTVEEIAEKMESMFEICHFHVIDSTTIAVSEDELECDVREWRPGITARAWGKVFRRLNERFDPNEHTVILIDQVRIKKFGGGGRNSEPQEEAAGGKVMDHQSSMSVSFKKGQWLYRNDDGFLDEKAKAEYGSSGMAEPSGYEIKARVEKSRVCRPFRTATVRLDLDNMMFDREFELSKAAIYYGLVTTTAKGSYEVQDESGEAIAKLRGEKQLRQFIRDNVDFAEHVENTQMEIALER